MMAVSIFQHPTRRHGLRDHIGQYFSVLPFVVHRAAFRLHGERVLPAGFPQFDPLAKVGKKFALIGRKPALEFVAGDKPNGNHQRRILRRLPIFHHKLLDMNVHVLGIAAVKDFLNRL